MSFLSIKKIMIFSFLIIGLQKSAFSEYLIYNKDGSKLSEKDYEKVRKFIFKYQMPYSNYFNVIEKTELSNKEFELLKNNEEDFLVKKLSSEFQNIKIKYIPDTLYQILYHDLALSELESEKDQKKYYPTRTKYTENTNLHEIENKNEFSNTITLSEKIQNKLYIENKYSYEINQLCIETDFNKKNNEDYGEIAEERLYELFQRSKKYSDIQKKKHLIPFLILRYKIDDTLCDESKDFNLIIQEVKQETIAHLNNELLLFRSTGGYQLKDETKTLDGIINTKGSSQLLEGLSYSYHLLDGVFHDSALLADSEKGSACTYAYAKARWYRPMYMLKISKKQLYNPDSFESKILIQLPLTGALAGLFGYGEHFHPRIGVKHLNLMTQEQQQDLENQFQDYLKNNAFIMNLNIKFSSHYSGIKSLNQ